MPADELFSDRLSEAMSRAGMTGRQVAQSAAIDAGYLSNLKLGKRSTPSAIVIKALAGVLGVREDWLAEGKGPMLASARVTSDDWVPAPMVRDAPGNDGEPLSETSSQPLDVIQEIRCEVIRCIQSGAPPPPRILALIGEIEAIVLDLRSSSEARKVGDRGKSMHRS